MAIPRQLTSQLRQSACSCSTRRSARSPPAPRSSRLLASRISRALSDWRDCSERTSSRDSGPRPRGWWWSVPRTCSSETQKLLFAACPSPRSLSSWVRPWPQAAWLAPHHMETWGRQVKTCQRKGRDLQSLAFLPEKSFLLLNHRRRGNSHTGRSFLTCEIYFLHSLKISTGIVEGTTKIWNHEHWSLIDDILFWKWLWQGRNQLSTYSTLDITN